MRNRAVTLLCLAIAAHACSAAEAVRHVRFTTHEGSWLSFDVSSDGRWIVMDLLGDLWRLPIEGGVAVRITNVVHDSAEFLEPAFPVDGATIIAHG